MRWKPILSMLVLASSFGCAYRFSNIAMKVPYGARRLAIEAVYDTSDDVLPHHILWQELYRSFAARGKMALSSAKDADIILRAHINHSDDSPIDIDRPLPDKDLLKGDDIFDPKKNGSPGDKFKNLMKAGSWTKKQGMGFVVRIDAWNLHTNQRIFDQTYNGGAQVLSLRGENLVNNSAQFLVFQEALINGFRRSSREIAEKVVTDFLL